MLLHCLAALALALPAADALEDHVLPSVARITETVRKTLEDA